MPRFPKHDFDVVQFVNFGSRSIPNNVFLSPSSKPRVRNLAQTNHKIWNPSLRADLRASLAQLCEAATAAKGQRYGGSTGHGEKDCAELNMNSGHAERRPKRHSENLRIQRNPGRQLAPPG